MTDSNLFHVGNRRIEEKGRIALKWPGSAPVRFKRRDAARAAHGICAGTVDDINIYRRKVD